MQYVILECTNTYRLYLWGQDNGLTVWVPLRHEKGRTVAAMPGYAFVPAHELKDFKRKVPPTYRAHVFRYSEEGEPRTCPVEDLEIMQRVINDAERVPLPDPAVVFKLGQRVRVVLGPFAGQDGVIEKVRGQTLRLVLTKAYITIPREYVALI